MPRTVSAGFMAAVFAQQTAEIFLTLLKIDHEDLDEPVLLVNNSEDIVHDGDTYTAFPFEMDLPDEIEGNMAKVAVTVDNAGLDLVPALRTINSPAEVTMKIILASDPDVVECGPFRFQTRGVSITSNAIRMELAYEDILNEPFPGDIMSPGNVPGIFR